MSKKIGKYAVIVVLYIALVSTLAFIIGTINLIVNADSINTEPNYEYMNVSHYNWDNIIWRTSDDTIVTGSNDTRSTLESWSDYYFVEEEREEETPTNTFNVDRNGTIYTFTIPTAYEGLSFSSIISNEGGKWYADDGSGIYYLYIVDGQVAITGSYVLRVPNGSTYATPSMTPIVGATYLTVVYSPDIYSPKDDNIMTLSNIIPLATETISYSIKRNITYNTDLSTLDTLVYDSTLVTDLKFTSIAFEKNNFFLKVGDLNKVGSPQISASVLNGGYNISFDISGYVKSNNGETRNISIVTDKREDVLGYQYLLPSKLELFGNVESIDNDSMMYIENIRVLVEFPNNYANELKYRYGVDSIEYNSLNYDNALSNWVNSSLGINMGDILLDNVNAFLQFEILPNFTLFNLFVLIVAIPLLIWILKLILGG